MPRLQHSRRTNGRWRTASFVASLALAPVWLSSLWADPLAPLDPTPGGWLRVRVGLGLTIIGVMLWLVSLRRHKGMVFAAGLTVVGLLWFFFPAAWIRVVPALILIVYAGVRLWRSGQS
jgi:hypothetical protein